jgi:hypothetical protein
MAEMRQVAGVCDDIKTCPKIFKEEEAAVVQGAEVLSGDDAYARLHLAPGETAVRIPAHLILEAADRLREEM